MKNNKLLKILGVVVAGMVGIVAARAGVLVEGVELAVGAEDEDAVDAAGDEVVDEPFEARQVEIFIGLHRGSDGRNDAADLHDEPRGGWAKMSISLPVIIVIVLLILLLL